MKAVIKLYVYLYDLLKLIEIEEAIYVSLPVACEGNRRQNDGAVLTNGSYSRLIYEVLNGWSVEGCILMHPSCSATRCDATRRNATQCNATTSLVPGNSKCCTIMRRSRLCSEIVLNDTASPAATRHAALTTPFTPSSLDHSSGHDSRSGSRVCYGILSPREIAISTIIEARFHFYVTLYRA